MLRSCRSTAPARSLLALLLLPFAGACGRARIVADRGEAGAPALDAGLVVALQDASTANSAPPLQACAEPPDMFQLSSAFYDGVQLDALHPVDRSAFASDQLTTKDWAKAPERIAIEAIGSRPRRLVIGDAAFTSCEIFVEASTPPVTGPFSGAPASDTWSASAFDGLHRVVVVVVDESRAVRGAHVFDNIGQIDTGFTLSRLDTFADGSSLKIQSYFSADGEDTVQRGVYGFVNGKFVELFVTTETLLGASFELYTLTATPPSASPTLTVVFKSHKTSMGTGKAISSTTQHTWDPVRHHFRK